ncbi:MAG: hypothetical protein KGL90_00015 [Burkholderiales bacterium]|nr:hypothetical protein [Burkholderiales bacterium]
MSLPLIACQPSKADDKARTVPRPSKQDLEQALNASYIPKATSKQECLGRLTFNVDGAFKWALSANTNTPKDQMPTVSREIRSTDETLDYDEFVYALIFPGATQAQLDEDYQNAIEKLIYLKQDLAKDIELREEILQDLIHEDPSKRDPNISQEKHDQYIVERKQEIAEKKAELATFGSATHPMDFGMPDRKGYAQGRYLQGYLLSQGVYYRFVMGDNSNDHRTNAEREAWFSDFMKRFQPRKLYEIPKERGVCFPYGFIPDDGTKPFHTAAGIRFDDRPNVLYVINTQVVGERPVTNTLFEATSRASVGLMPGFANEEVAKVIKKRVGPHRAFIGELASEQGGAAVRLTEGKRQFDNYSVYTGYMGWMGSQVLPFIAVDMRSFTRAQTARSEIERLKTDPPPFEESKGRLDALLKSVRLRPTTPTMPELQF